MDNSGFVHLHVHDQYSQLDGFGTAKEYITRAKELGFTSLATTNHGNIDGLIKFQTECDKQGINPILGCEMYIVPDAKVKPKQKENRGHITILIKNETGWNEICKLLNYANIEGFHYRPRIDYNSLLSCDTSGFIIMTGCSGSFIMYEEKNFFERLADKTQDDDNLYAEIMPHDIPMQYDYHEKLKSLSNIYAIPYVATNDCHYIYPEDSKAQEVLLAIQTSAKWNDKDRFKFGFDGLYLRTVDEMLKAFEKYSQFFSKREIMIAMKNTVKIANQCKDFRIKKRQINLPWDRNEGNPNSVLKEIVKEKRLKFIRNKKICELEVGTYDERIKEELDLIEKKGFSAYFLIVYKTVRWARSQGIMVGPGRGSCGGSLVAYLLGITEIDSIKHNLLFSRFMAEYRNDMPDIDLDFEDARRDEVKDYLKKEYGEWNTSGISTFTTMKARGVLRDVSRVFGVEREVDSFAKAISIYDKDDKLVEKYANETEEGKLFDKRNPEVVDVAILLENQIKGSGQHAAGIIISGEDLRECARGVLVQREKKLVINWDMEDCEYMGLMKMDILGLNNLTIINGTLKNICDNPHIFKDHDGLYFIADPNHLEDLVTDIRFDSDLGPFNFDTIPLDDDKVFDELNKGHTMGVFQFSTKLMTDLAQKINIKSFENMSACVALGRPGPTDSGMTELYIERKNSGKLWKRKHNIYEEITKDTYGVIVYQEQVMKIISEIAGLSYSVADKIRKIIAKLRSASEFEQYWEMFLEGCLNTRNMDEAEAEEFWEGLQAHANYSFNRAHSVAYALIAYYTIWLRIYYPTEYICSALTYGKDDKKEEIIKEAFRLGLKLIPPKIGISKATEWTCKDKKLYIPFSEIKGVGESKANEIVNSKKKESKKQLGFFKNEAEKGFTPSIEKLLRAINAFDPDGELPDEGKSFFGFSLTGDIRDIYPTLYKIVGDSDSSLDIPKNIIKKRRYVNQLPLGCKACQLREECDNPILSSAGIYNISVVGEAPGRDENEEGKGYIGDAGKLLWKELDKYGLRRNIFHVANVCRCWPSISKTPNKKQIDSCFPFLIKELQMIECRLILATGNIPLRAFTGEAGGITGKNGTIEWNEKIGAWICWCVHPSSVLHNPLENKKYFEEGIKNFAETVKRLI